MRVPATPACDIDWRREFCLPVGIPPGALTPTRRIDYARTLEATAAVLHSTHGRYTVAAPAPEQIRAAPKGASNRMVLPRFSAADADDVNLPAASAGVRASGPFSTAPPAPGTAEQVEAALAGKLPYDDISRRFTPLPIPRAGMDTIVFTFAEPAGPGLTDTLGLDEPGILGEDGRLPTALPDTLLATTMSSGGPVLGELDRLLVRAPATGRFRFEPYLHYRWNGAAFTPEGPSSTGRLLVQQPHLGIREAAEHTETQVFKPRVFVIDHVDRATVARAIEHLLVLQVAFLTGMDAGFRGVAGAEPRLSIPSGSLKVRLWALETVNSLLRAWTSFLAVLRWRPDDTTVAGEIPSAWAMAFPERDLTSSDAAAVLAAVEEIGKHPSWLVSLRTFIASVYSRLLAGYSWLEVLAANGQELTRRFPVPSDLPPYTPRVDAQVKQHDRLRRVADPQFRWLACFAGSPIGGASRAFGAGLTTFELEALHAAGTAHLALGLATPVAGAGPRPGRAMDLTPYAGQAKGHVCAFQAEPLGLDGLHTTIDWLLELTTGIHFRQEEPAFLDLTALMDPDNGSGHPLLAALRTDEHLKAVHLRRQMDGLAGTGLGGSSLTWWVGKLAMPTDSTGTKWKMVTERSITIEESPAPRTPYRKSRTTLQQFLGSLVFTDLHGTGDPSGFDLFDIASAYLATERMCEPPDGPDQLPLVVLLALMEREGIKGFAPLTRHVRNTKTEAATLSWEAHDQVLARAEWPADLDQMGRDGCLLWPYGLDRFAQVPTDAAFNAKIASMESPVAPPPDLPVLRRTAGEDVAGYLRRRAWSRWHVIPPPPGAGVPAVWKRSRRMHWASLSLMAGFFRQLEIQINHPSTANGFAEAGWSPDAGWLPVGSSPPDLTGKGPADPEWKDYLTYYALIYMVYNTSTETWRKYVKGAEAARLAAGSALSLRDFLVFKHARGRHVIGNMVRFAIGLDAFLRLDLLEGKAPKDYAAATPDTTPATTRAWP
jgi:hypothetical protein